MIRRTITTALVVGIPRAALACPVCFGQTDSPLASATNMGIIAMLGIIGSVLAGFAAFIVHLNRRAKLRQRARSSHRRGQASGRLPRPRRMTAHAELPGLPVAASQHASHVDSLISRVLDDAGALRWLMGVLLLFVIVVKFRKGANPRQPTITAPRARFQRCWKSASSRRNRAAAGVFAIPAWGQTSRIFHPTTRRPSFEWSASSPPRRHSLPPCPDGKVWLHRCQPDGGRQPARS